MSTKFYSINTGDFLAWLENFISVANNNLAELNLTSEDIAALKDSRSELVTKFHDSTAKREASQASTVALNQVRKTVNKKVGSLNKIFKANENTPKTLLGALGLNANGDSLSTVAALAPADLVVEGRSNGINYIKFRRNGNKPAVNFLLEAKTGDETAYKFVAVTRKTRFEHKNQTPGVRVFYRVKAIHGESESAYSNEAVIYN